MENNTQWKTKRTVRIGVDFQKIENDPKTDLHQEILKKVATQPSPVEVLIENEQKEMARRAISRAGLSKRERECVRLTLQGLSNLEIAEELNISDSAIVRMHIRRAATKLKKYVGIQILKNKF